MALGLNKSVPPLQMAYIDLERAMEGKDGGWGGLGMQEAKVSVSLRATMFKCGRKAGKYPKIVKVLLTQPHKVLDHEDSKDQLSSFCR